MPRKRHPELEGYPPQQPLYTFELKSRRKTVRNRLVWTLVGLSIGVGLTLGAYSLLPLSNRWEVAQNQNLSEEDPFQKGSNRAMNAAELTQTAEFQEDWSQVAVLWQQAINNMRSVPSSNPNYAIAQDKLVEYTRNLSYAKSNVASRPPGSLNKQPYWTIGSDRELVISIQGMPERVSQFNTLCKEIFHYDNSTVELRNGYVTNFSDPDTNLSVLGDAQIALSIQPEADMWSIGSSQEAVFQAQGTPTRTSTYKDVVTLHYDESFVELKGNRVVGYDNLSGNLQVSMSPLVFHEEVSSSTTWGLGSSRAEVLSIEQQTPTTVRRSDSSCEEVFNFESSTVTFRRGLVSEYSNFAQNLNIQ
ncbi:hypothetical protein PN498_18935 [Oscillatoria sp. CS-180]|uniref:hypothetical protein n=1 Tax=Oscillatoria sp. CS-180 TaxID=3021720 RepID=UPI00232D08F8|nr:hypothetical protein [Oscillatoria sp. CS-180]MDB9528078.1 hypothetical protein [Oscillatoria sp. CS-180]